jgi:hypothetical protein
MRRWTWLSEDGPVEEESELRLVVIVDQINKLVDRWNDLEERYEVRRNRQYPSGEMFDCGEAEYEMCEEQAQEEADERGLEGRDAREYVERRVEEMLAERDREEERYFEKLSAEQEVIEEMMRSLGARFRRPYEHWNEEEKYMEYMENRTSRYDD